MTVMYFVIQFRRPLGFDLQRGFLDSCRMQVGKNTGYEFLSIGGVVKQKWSTRLIGCGFVHSQPCNRRSDERSEMDAGPNQK